MLPHSRSSVRHPFPSVPHLFPSDSSNTSLSFLSISPVSFGGSPVSCTFLYCLARVLRCATRFLGYLICFLNLPLMPHTCSSERHPPPSAPHLFPSFSFNTSPVLFGASPVSCASSSVPFSFLEYLTRVLRCAPRFPRRLTSFFQFLSIPHSCSLTPHPLFSVPNLFPSVLSNTPLTFFDTSRISFGTSPVSVCFLWYPTNVPQ